MTTNYQAEQLILADATTRRAQYGAHSRAGRIAARLAVNGAWINGWCHSLLDLSYPRTGRIGVRAKAGAVGLHAAARSYPQGSPATWSDSETGWRAL